MKSPNEIYKTIDKNGGLDQLAAKTGMTRIEILRAIRDGADWKTRETIAHALNLSVKELFG